jgi:hypothetical protein
MILSGFNLEVRRRTPRVIDGMLDSAPGHFRVVFSFMFVLFSGFFLEAENLIH